MVAHALVIDRFGNVGLNVDHERLAGTGITLGGRVEVEAGGERYVATYAQTFADVEPGRADRLRGRLPHARARDQPRRRGRHARPRRGRRGAAAAAMIGTPRVHHRLTDSTNERAKELAARGRAARHARDGRRADARAAAARAAPGPRRPARRVLMSLVLRDARRAPRAAAARGRRGGVRGVCPAPTPRSSGRTTSGSTAARSPASCRGAAAGGLGGAGDRAER